MNLGKRWVGAMAVALAASACSGNLFEKQTGSSGSGSSIGSGGAGGRTSGGGATGGTTGSAGTPLHLDGTVTDARTSTPISGAQVAFNGSSVQSDSTGHFSMDVVASGEVLLQVTDLAYAPQVAMVKTKAGTPAYQVPVQLTALQAQPVSPAGGVVTFTTWNGHTVTMTIPANAFPDAGTVHVRVASFDPRSGPGALEVESPGDGGNGLQSTALFYFDAVDSAGVAVNPAPGTLFTTSEDPVTLQSIPTAEAVQGWKLTANGRWTPAGNSTPAGPHPHTGGPSFSPSQFGFWNSDRAFRTACVIGHLASPGGACSGQHVQGFGPDGIASNDNSASDGSFCVMGAQTWPSTLSAGQSVSMQITMPASAGDCAHPSSCQDIGTVSMPESECPHANGADAGAPSVDGGTQQCNSDVVSGGDAPEIHTIELGKSAGSFVFTWDMYTIPDHMIVTYQGQTLLDTGCVSDTGSQTLTYSGSSTSITVQVLPSCDGETGTAWDFSVSCP